MSTESEKPNRLRDAATWPRLGLLWAAVLLGTALFALRYAVIWSGRPPGEQLTGPDGRHFGYNGPELSAYFTAIGPDGVSLYATTQLTLDLLFPLAYGAFFAGLIVRLCSQRWLALIPVIAAAADLFENLILATLAWLFHRPHAPAGEISGWDTFASIAGCATMTKWTLVGVTAVVVACGLVMNIPNAWRALRGACEWLKRFGAGSFRAPP